jgi:sec-independent protein translocase protein TatA
MLGLDNPIHIAFILIVLLLIFGAKRLPEMGKSMGEGLRGFKDSLSGDGAAMHITTEHATHTDELTAATPIPVETAAEPTVERTPVAVERTVERTPLTPAA